MAKNDLTISKERIATIAEQLQQVAERHGKGFEIDLDTDFDVKEGVMEVTISFTRADQAEAIEKYKTLIARQIKNGTFGQEEEKPARRDRKAEAEKEAAAPKKRPAKPAAASAETTAEKIAAYLKENVDGYLPKYDKYIADALAGKATALDSHVGKLLDDKELMASIKEAKLSPLFVLLALFEFDAEEIEIELSKMEARRLAKASEFLESQDEDEDEDGDDTEGDDEDDEDGEDEDGEDEDDTDGDDGDDEDEEDDAADDEDEEDDEVVVTKKSSKTAAAKGKTAKARK